MRIVGKVRKKENKERGWIGESKKDSREKNEKDSKGDKERYKDERERERVETEKWVRK
jgi:hypothetical protein